MKQHGKQLYAPSNLSCTLQKEMKVYNEKLQIWSLAFSAIVTLFKMQIDLHI